MRFEINDIKNTVLVLLICLLAITSFAQPKKTENVFLITLDGLRWQELFSGADSALIEDQDYVDNPEELKSLFWAETAIKRRSILMPFFWNTISKEGQLYGNRWEGSMVNSTNQMWFSYPGYNEILTGYADDERISSNDKISNPNVTILEFANNKKRFRGKVGAFGSWDVFPYIVNEQRSGISVNAGFRKSNDSPLSEKEKILNELQDQIPSPWGSVRLDAFTHHYALEYLKKRQPRLLYIAYGETDDFAHDGEYDHYLKSARQTDEFVKELWEYAQSTEQYKGKTTFIITTDHGRGTEPKKTWKDHGNKIPNAGEVWIAVIGPDTKPLGMDTKGQFYQSQVARTVTSLLNINYEEAKAGKPLRKAIN